MSLAAAWLGDGDWHWGFGANVALFDRHGEALRDMRGTRGPGGCSIGTAFGDGVSRGDDTGFAYGIIFGGIDGGVTCGSRTFGTVGQSHALGNGDESFDRSAGTVVVGDGGVGS